MNDSHSLLPLAEQAGGFLISIATILIPLLVVICL
jgi:hypothetical protein